MKHESKIPKPHPLLRCLGGMDRKMLLHMKRENNTRPWKLHLTDLGQIPASSSRVLPHQPLHLY
ncbi:MAG: hypothetical protein C5B46_05865 [Proteobacteria bacterium]|nr:MAG: hypothetical protein C5B46_05865 [Pseudomonadota bacterium]